jgi:hypothetical protein
LVTFFARGEVLTGLCNLAAFISDDFEIVATPWGSGCSFMVTWPLHYLAKGKARAVLGCGDPSARKFMKTDEMTFTVPYALYEAFLARWRESFLETDTWSIVKKKIVKSKVALGGTVPTQHGANFCRGRSSRQLISRSSGRVSPLCSETLPLTSTFRLYCSELKNREIPYENI